MKNEHILPNTEVPIELRKEVYREALRIIESGEKKYIFQKHSDWLCWLTMSILYDTDIYEAEFKEGHILYCLDFENSDLMFPEIVKFKKRGDYALYTNQERIEFLKSVI